MLADGNIKIGTVMKGWGSSVGRKRDNKKISHEERLGKRKAILDALAKASEDSQSLEENASVPGSEANDYYSLTHDEMEALINGDMEKIESWVSNLDRRHATWLLRWLIKER
jgi:hypothetical protein